MFRVYVLEYKLIPPQHFLYEMSLLELYMLNDNFKYINKDEWERFRLGVYILKQDGVIKKGLDIKKWMPFEWEQFKGSTKADKKMVDWWNKNKNKLAQQKTLSVRLAKERK